VAELMVIYNAAAAYSALQAGIPFLYRCLEDKIKVEKDAAGILRTLIPASMLTFAPVKHQAMGLDIYAQVTSPLRRYSDLINQRQLTSHLEGRAIPYTQTDLQSMLLHLNQTRRKIKQL
jgi:exoribonuclease-2